MKTEQEIKDKIILLETEKRKWCDKQNNYKFSAEEKINGSTYYGSLQEQEVLCTRQIDLLWWILNDKTI